MKKVIPFFLLFFLCISFTYAQELPNLKHVKLNKNSHFKSAEQTALKVISYLLETPINKKNKSRTEAGQFLLKWMDGTPYHTFYLEEKETIFFNTDADLMLMYMASLTKFSLENPAKKDQKTLVLGALTILLPYLDRQEDKKSWSRELTQLNEANKDGKLEAYLYHD